MERAFAQTSAAFSQTKDALKVQVENFIEGLASSSATRRDLHLPVDDWRNLIRKNYGLEPEE
jgi:hypothetical protein